MHTLSDEKLQILSERIGYCFGHSDNLRLALSHRSHGKQNYERLEFLGDAVLNFIVAAELFQRYPNWEEGALSRLRSTLVQEKTLGHLANCLDLRDFLQLGAGERKQGSEPRVSILADVVEALIGAIYLDSNFTACSKIVLSWYQKVYSDLSALEPQKDAKSELQEWTQRQKLPLPLYEIVEITGPAHQKHFLVRCRVEGTTHDTQGQGSTRRAAEQDAARLFLQKL